MNPLDVRTVMVSHWITATVCVFVVAVLWYQNRQHFAGTSCWVLDFGLQATAAVLVILRGSIPDWMSTVLSNTLVIAGALAGYVGLERFLGKPSRQVHNYILLAVFPLVHSYFAFAQPNLAARNLNLSLALLILCFQCAWLMLRRVPSAMRQMTMGVGHIFVLFSLFSLVRIAVILANPSPDQDFFRSGLYDTLILLAYQVLFILLAYGLTLMVNGRLEEKLKQMSIHDALTGLYNRGFFEEEMTRLDRGRQFPISVIAGDLNHLKETNDREGHAAGDALLKRAAQVLLAAFRAEDVVARIGGDEFAVLLPDTDAPAAEEALRRAKRRLQEHNVAHGGTPISIALGASTAQKGTPLADALKEADARMYEEKRAS
jgi:diguanylate cyclase (GGDEF)-like protein